MKFWAQIVWIIVLAFLLELFLPWWTVAIAGAIGGYLSGKGRWHNFKAGFAAIFLLWAGYALLILLTTGSPLPTRMAAILSLPPNPYLLILVTGFFGGIAAGLGSMAGGEFRQYASY